MATENRVTFVASAKSGLPEWERPSIMVFNLGEISGQERGRFDLLFQDEHRGSSRSPGHPFPWECGSGPGDKRVRGFFWGWGPDLGDRPTVGNSRRCCAFAHPAGMFPASDHAAMNAQT
jgi:hypothetical protein